MKNNEVQIAEKIKKIIPEQEVYSDDGSVIILVRGTEQEAKIIEKKLNSFRGSKVSDGVQSGGIYIILNGEHFCEL